MNEQSAYLVRAATGPIILITVGVLFAFDRFTDFRFGQTWPVLLIVIGLLRLAGGGRRRQYRDFPGGYNSAKYNPPRPPRDEPPPGFEGPGARP